MTEEERDSIRHLGVMVEDLRSQTQLVAEGVTMANQRLESLEGSVGVLAAATERNSIEIAAHRSETAREFKAVRAEAEAFRAETAQNFAAVRAEAEAFRTETAQNFAAVRAEAEAFRAETARSFADVRAEADAFRAETAQDFAEVGIFRVETGRNFADVRALVVATYSDLDRRLRAVEKP